MKKTADVSRVPIVAAGQNCTDQSTNGPRERSGDGLNLSSSFMNIHGEAKMRVAIQARIFSKEKQDEEKIKNTYQCLSQLTYAATQPNVESNAHDHPATCLWLVRGCMARIARSGGDGGSQKRRGLNPCQPSQVICIIYRLNCLLRRQDVLAGILPAGAPVADFLLGNPSGTRSFRESKMDANRTTSDRYRKLSAGKPASDTKLAFLKFFQSLLAEAITPIHRSRRVCCDCPVRLKPIMKKIRASVLALFFAQSIVFQAQPQIETRTEQTVLERQVQESFERRKLHIFFRSKAPPL